MGLRTFLYKLKKDLRSLWTRPDVDLDQHGHLDYNRYWAARRPDGSQALSDWQTSRAQWALSQIEKDSVVLDLGCGSGNILKYLMDHSSIQGLGVDISETVLQEAQAHGINTFCLDINDPEALKTLPEVDYVLAFEILEHLPVPEAMINALKSKVRKGFIISFPNTGYYSHRLRLLLGRTPLQWVTHPAEHLRFWTVQDTRWWIKSLGLYPKALKAYNGLPGLNRLWPALFGQGLIFLASTDHKK